jgi:hypothetical protein
VIRQLPAIPSPSQFRVRVSSCTAEKKKKNFILSFLWKIERNEKKKKKHTLLHSIKHINSSITVEERKQASLYVTRFQADRNKEETYLCVS